MVRATWRPSPRLKADVDAIVKRAPRETREAITKALAINGEEITPVIKRATPVDDGDLQKSITWTFGPPPPGVLGVTEDRSPEIPDDLRISIYAGGPKARHAHLVHDGTGPRTTADGKSTGIMPPRPFFFPYIRAYRRRFRNRILRLARKGLKDALQ